MASSTPHHFLLTGANGFIATHILAELLSSPTAHKITATVRTAAKEAALRALFPASAYPRLATQLTIVLVPDMAAPNAFDALFAATAATPTPIDIVLHTASPFLYRAATGTNAADFLDPAIKGTKNLLQAAREAGSVRRVVMTSSCAAVIDYKREAAVEAAARAGTGNGVADRKVYVESDWNDVTYSEGEAGDKSTAYRASKKFSELVAWGFVGGVEGGEGELLVKNDIAALGAGEAGFDLVVLCPPAVFGPVVAGSVERIADLGESNTRFYKLFVDSAREKVIANKMPLHVYVDVRDLAHAHVLSAIVPEAGNKRFLICGGSFSNWDVTSALRGSIPELEERTPDLKLTGVKQGLSETDYGYSSERAIQVLGMEYRGMDSTWVELGKQLLEIEKGEK